jgi:hypothetical protein
LQSLHSALIDELCEQHPEPKPELGMPQRFEGYLTPPDGMGELRVHEVGMGEEKGVTVLSLDARASDALGGTTVHALWEAVMKRAGREFQLRGIQPVMGPAPDLAKVRPKRTIWIPVRLSRGVCFLGVAV